MRRFTIFSLLILAVFLTGCIQSNTLIRVNPDGSGVVEETVLFSDMLVSSMQNLSKKMSDADSKNGNQGKTEDGDFIRKQMKDGQAKITKLGPDVKFVSVTPVKTETMKGYKTVYSFRDINTLRINQNPSDKTGKPEDQRDKSTEKKEMLLFTFKKGDVPTLTVRMPGKDESGTNKEKQKTEQRKTPEEEASAAEMMKIFFKDMAVRIDIEIAGTIIKTNATYRDKTRLTLMDIQFGKIFENKEVFDKLNKTQPKTIEEMKGIVKDLKGLKIELNNPLVVDFR
jgi:hypothetical protein